MSFVEYNLLSIRKFSFGHHKGGLDLVVCEISQYEVEYGTLNIEIFVKYGSHSTYEREKSCETRCQVCHPRYMEIELLWDMLLQIEGTLNIRLHVFVCDMMSCVTLGRVRTCFARSAGYE